MDDVKRPPTSNNGTHGFSNNNLGISGHNSPRVDAPDSSSTSIPVSFGHKPTDEPIERPHNFDTYTPPSEHSEHAQHFSEAQSSSDDKNDSFNSSDLGNTQNSDNTDNSDDSNLSSGHDPLQEPAPEPESPQEPEVAQEPTNVQVEEKPASHEAPNDGAPVFDSPDTKLEKPSDESSSSSSQSSSQKGAGLDLSSLSNEDANDLGIQKPAAEDVQISRTALAASKPKKSNKSTFIVVAILIAIALMAGAGYAYMQSGKKTSSATPATTPAVENKTTTTELKAADIDKASTDLDTTLKKVDDTKDFASTDLSDSSLGLQ